MSQRRRTPYKAPRDRREVVVAVLCAVAVVVVTATLVWVFRPNKDLGSNKTVFPEPTTTVVPAETTPPPTRRPPPLRLPELAPSHVPDRLRTDFEASRGFPLDRFQQRALDALDAGTNVLVAAPTGSGKTVIAEYAIARALADGGKGFYTTPLKALSNQKYGDLVEAHGAATVGLLTGDNSVHGDAGVVVMTTEVLRNMIYAASPALDALRVVVLDEVHYLQDRYRGPVWEEVIVHLAASVRLVCLSATVSNAEEVAAWIETVRGPTTAIIEEDRPVRLEHRYLIAERGTERLHLLPTFVTEPDGPTRGALVPNPEATRLDGGRSTRGRGSSGPRPRSGPRTPAHAGTRRDRRAPGRRADAARHRLRVQPRRVRPGGRAVPRCRPRASPIPASGPRSAPSSSARRPRSPTTTSTSSTTGAGSRASRPASPPTTRAWCRR